MNLFDQYLSNFCHLSWWMSPFATLTVSETSIIKYQSVTKKMTTRPPLRSTCATYNLQRKLNFTYVTNSYNFRAITTNDFSQTNRCFRRAPESEIITPWSNIIKRSMIPLGFRNTRNRMRGKCINVLGNARTCITCRKCKKKCLKTHRVPSKED